MSRREISALLSRLILIEAEQTYDPEQIEYLLELADRADAVARRKAA